MKRICLVLGVAAMCGCVRHYRSPVASEEATPHRESVVPSDPQTRPEAPGIFEPPPNRPAYPKPANEPAPPSADERISAVNGQLEDVFFPYDQFDLQPTAIAALQHDAALLRGIVHDFPAIRIDVEGHCDERGSAEYNIGLGDRRAVRAVDYLRQLGVPPANLAPVSYGKEAPQCVESTESCWSRNRRAHLVVRLIATM